MKTPPSTPRKARFEALKARLGTTSSPARVIERFENLDDLKNLCGSNTSMDKHVAFTGTVVESYEVTNGHVHVVCGDQTYSVQELDMLSETTKLKMEQECFTVTVWQSAKWKIDFFNRYDIIHFTDIDHLKVWKGTNQDLLPCAQGEINKDCQLTKVGVASRLEQDENFTDE